MTNGHDKGSSPTRSPDHDGESKKRKYPTDRSYFIAKEFLTTERTYKKDLEVIDVVSQPYLKQWVLVNGWFYLILILLKVLLIYNN